MKIVSVTGSIIERIQSPFNRSSLVRIPGHRGEIPLVFDFVRAIKKMNRTRLIRNGAKNLVESRDSEYSSLGIVEYGSIYLLLVYTHVCMVISQHVVNCKNVRYILDGGPGYE